MDTGPAVDAELVASALDLTQRAGAVALEWFTSGRLDSRAKADGSPVTEADRATEEFLRGELARRFPDDGVVGEEYGTSEGTSGRRWVIDPIDGTRSFVRGVPLFATLLALFDEAGPAVGVAHIPALDESVAAGRGTGAQHHWGGDVRTATVSTQSRLDGACLVTSGYEYLPGQARRLLMDAPGGLLVRTWGDGYGYVLVATGRAEIMLDAGLALWDVAPMLVIIPEAGGRITNYEGTPSPRADNVVATNSHLHQATLALLTPP